MLLLSLLFQYRKQMVLEISYFLLWSTDKYVGGNVIYFVCWAEHQIVLLFSFQGVIWGDMSEQGYIFHIHSFLYLYIFSYTKTSRRPSFLVFCFVQGTQKTFTFIISKKSKPANVSHTLHFGHSSSCYSYVNPYSGALNLKLLEFFGINFTNQLTPFFNTSC